MKNLLIILLIIVTNSLSAKTVDLNEILRGAYNNKEYSKCYSFCKTIIKFSSNLEHPKNLNENSLYPMAKYKSNISYRYDSLTYYELKSLKEIDVNQFYYVYFLRKNYLKKDSTYCNFISWVDSLYNSPIKVGFDNTKNSKLNEIFKMLEEYDTLSFKEIFYIDNSELVNIVKNRNEKNVLNMTSNHFDIDYSIVKGDINSKLSNIQIKLANYFETLVNEKRFMNEEQVLNFFFKNTKFTDEEKMMVSYYFVNKYLVWCGAYDKAGSYSNIDKIVLNRLTPCNGFSLLLQSLLSKNGIECNLVGLEIKNVGILHANNIVILNKKVYYVDATWGVYYKDISKLPNSVVVSSYVGDSKYPFNYTKIKSLDYIIFMQKYHQNTSRKDVDNVLDLIKKGAY